MNPRLAAAFLLLCSAASAAPAAPKRETRYLLFQMFTSAAVPESPVGGSRVIRESPGRAAIMRFARGVKKRIGSAGGKRRKLGIAPGPIAFDHDDGQVKRLIRDSFAAARALNMAVAFHLDDSLFWTRHPELRAAEDAVEWLDWEGTRTTGRRIDWGASPTKLPPQLCFNSPSVKRAVRSRAALIGREIRRELAALKKAGRAELFAGVIAGWETQIGRDFETGKYPGYCALSNKGFSRDKPPRDIDAARSDRVREFVELWARSLAKNGIPRNRIYAHIAFTTQGFSPPGQRKIPYERQVHFSPPRVAFSRHYRPGFSAYPAPGVIEEILSSVKKHGAPPWAMVEGTNVIPNGMPGEKTMETYLGRMFNHGAVMVNIFSWGIGGPGMKNNFFRKATEGPEAIAAYRRFLAGKRLREDPANPFSIKSFQHKIHAIHSKLPRWVQRTRRQRDAERLMRRLDAHIKKGRIREADGVADEALRLLEER